MKKTSEVGVYLRETKDKKKKTYYITYKDNNGKKIWHKVGHHCDGVRLKYCKELRDNILVKQRLGEELPNIARKAKQKQGIEYCDIWEFYIENRTMPVKRKKELKGIWNNHFQEFFSRLITLEGIKSFRETKLKTHSPKTINDFISLLGTTINFWNTKNPKKSISNPITTFRDEDRLEPKTQEKTDRTRKRERYLTKEEISLFIEHLEDKHEDLKLFVALSLSTGGRLNTITSIKKKDIKGRTVSLINHKTGGKRYTGFLNDQSLELLSKRLPTLALDDSIFILETGQIQKRVQYILTKLFNQGLDSRDTVNRAVVHTLRHTFGSHLAINGTPLVKIKNLMNHSKIETTMRYAHLAPDAGLDDVANLYT